MFYLASLWVQKMNSFKILTSVQIRCANVLKSLLTQLFPHKVSGIWPEYFSLYASMLLLLLLFLWIMLGIKEVWRFFVRGDSRYFSISTGTKIQLDWKMEGSSGVTYSWSEHPSSVAFPSKIILQGYPTQGCCWNIWCSYEPQPLCKNVYSHPCKKTC